MAERVLGAVLAAGQARRFGGGKLDAPCAGRRLGSWALRAVEHDGARQAAVAAETSRTRPSDPLLPESSRPAPVR